VGRVTALKSADGNAGIWANCPIGGAAWQLPGRDVCHLTASDLHRHQRIQVQIGLHPKLVEIERTREVTLYPGANTDTPLKTVVYRWLLP
jgi:hypothetical protein